MRKFKSKQKKIKAITTNCINCNRVIPCSTSTLVIDCNSVDLECMEECIKCGYFINDDDKYCHNCGCDDITEDLKHFKAYEYFMNYY